MIYIALAVVSLQPVLCSSPLTFLSRCFLIMAAPMPPITMVLACSGKAKRREAFTMRLLVSLVIGPEV